MKKLTYIIPIILYLILFSVKSDAQHLLKPRSIDVRSGVLGNPDGTIATTKIDVDSMFAHFYNRFFGGYDGSNTEILFRYRDTVSCDGHLPSIGLYWSISTIDDTLVVDGIDSTGYWHTLTDSIRVYNKWIHLTLSDSINGIVEALAFKVKSTHDDTANVDSTWNCEYDFLFNTR